MKRDMDLIRELMLKLEALPLGSRDVVYIDPDAMAVDGYDAHQIDYHLQLLEQAGLIDAGGLGGGVGPGIAFGRLSWAGHDFLDAVRSPDVWDRTTQAATAAGGFTVELLMFAAKTYLEGKIKGVIGG
ncbi:hypothetical protein BGV52_29625 [Burkholderia ubonensis]|uniref:DUF2513 domain-containing protein n=1 Tax=Burkholderia ubonensis TaxID=101571 RepID=UPI0007561615|nr:DUF2513 domain-containing protein [Burkholderia ubonensis]KVW61708.1 hypothetical protein WK98_29325 [Burkholderia ubonensis]OJB03531.1 hypothetical protein BGV52_29625 [Burkholderia ubonensis]OJB57014.1 hypothetical protein BGV61_19515 [Burkholderia ubonensis]HEM8495069.1 DUF2513 domain-containing protein [Burkholderia multivorans]